MSGLKRIILIDTHLPGLVELKVDGHTNICGTNASGKTTLQRLIPVFYGESPNKVVPATRDNFQTWYLPRESSFIIFEYQRLDGAMCMAVLTSSATGVVYRFIGKDFDLNDFIADDLVSESTANADTLSNKRSLAITEIIRNMRRNDIVTSKNLNTKEFRAIIQNDRAVMSLSANKRDLLAMSRYFSLCEADARLRHIEKLIKAVHSKEGKMETIKAMIAAILEEDGVETPTNKISKAQVEDWIKECSLIKQFDDLMPKYKKLQKVNAQLEHTEVRLSQLKQQFSVDFSLLSESIVTSDANHGTYKSHLNEINKNFEVQRDELNRDISKANAEHKTCESQLDKIEDEFNVWQDKDIETHQANIGNISAWQSQLQSLTEQHALLTEEHQDIEAAYHKREAELEKKQSKEVAQLNQQKDSVNNERQKAQREEHQAVVQLVATQEQRLASINVDFDRQINESKLNLQTVKTEIELSGPTQQEQQSLAMQEANFEQAQHEEDQSRSNLQELQEQLQQAKYQQIGCNEHLNNSRAKVKSAQQRVEKIYAWLNPDDNTLLSFLRQEYKGWEQSVGKVINPDLLARSDLSPTLLDNSEQQTLSLFGVNIDTHAIAESDLLQTESQLQQQLEQAEQELASLRGKQLECEQALNAVNEQVRDLQQQQTQLHSQCQFKQQGRVRIGEDLAQLKAELKQALLERKQKREKALTQLQSALDKLLLNKQNAIEEHKDQCHEDKMEHEMHWQQVIGIVEQKLESINELINASATQYKEGLKACKKWYKDELANRDVDVEQIASLKQQISKIKDDIDITNKHRDSVNDYVRWFEQTFTKQKAGYITELSKAKQVKANAERLFSEKLSTYKRQKHQLQEQIEQIEKALQEQKQLANGINQLKPQFALLNLPHVELVDETSTVNARLQEGRELFEAQRRASQDIDSFVSYFDNAIGQKSGISLTETWEHARRQCLKENPQGIEVLDSRKMVTELDTLLTVLVPQHLAGVRNNGLNFGNDLTQYYNVLSDIDKRISSQSKRISKEVDHELFLDGVSESMVKIRSKIAEFDFWPKLLRFNQLHYAWLNDQNATLPDEEYMQTIREVLEVLGKATVSSGISQLLDIELHLKEGNSDLVIRTDRQLNESSSHGMAYLILCKFLLAFTRLLRGNSQAIIHWPIDEIGTLANKNVKKIFDACKANNITVLGAFPNPESDVLYFFENRYLIDKNAKAQKLRMVQPKVKRISELIKQRKQAEELV